MYQFGSRAERSPSSNVATAASRGHLDVQRRPFDQAAGSAVLGRELDLVVLRLVVAADDRDLEAARRSPAASQTSTRWPSRKPSASQPGSVGAGQARAVGASSTRRRQNGATVQPCGGRVDLDLDLALELAGLVRRLIVVVIVGRRRRADHDGGLEQRQHGVGDGRRRGTCRCGRRRRRRSGSAGRSRSPRRGSCRGRCRSRGSASGGRRAVAEGEVAEEHARRDVAADRLEVESVSDA